MSRARKQPRQKQPAQTKAVTVARVETPPAAASSRPVFEKRRLIAILLILITGAALYAPTLPFPMQFDDEMYLQHNPLVRDPASFSFPLEFQEFMKRARERGFSDDLTVNFVLRPLAYLTFHLNYLLGGFAPGGFRAVNIVVHGANGLLVFALVSLLLRLGARAGRMPDRGTEVFVPAVAALLFVAHPLHIESVTYIVQRFTSLAAFFYLGAVVCHLLSHTAPSRRKCLAWRAASVIALLAGMLTKETVFTAPLAIVCIERLVLRASWRDALKRSQPALALLPLIPCTVWLSHATLTDGSSTLGEVTRIVQFNNIEDYQLRYLLTQFPVVLSYLRLLVLPGGLNVDPDVPLAAAALDARVLLSALALLVIALVPVILFLRRRGSARRAPALLGVLWFFLTISVTSTIIPLPDLMAEHHTYLPSVGFFIVTALMLDSLRAALSRRAGWSATPHAAAACWVLALCAATVMRNEVWRTELSLWQDTAAKSPEKARVLGNLAVILHNSGRRDEAEKLFQKAVTCREVPVLVKANLGRLLNIQKRYAESLAVSERALRRSPNVSELHFNRAVSLCNLGRLEDARLGLHEALRHSPRHAPSHLALGHLNLMLEQPAAALPHLKQAIHLGIKGESVEKLYEEALAKAGGVNDAVAAAE